MGPNFDGKSHRCVVVNWLEKNDPPSHPSPKVDYLFPDPEVTERITNSLSFNDGIPDRVSTISYTLMFQSVRRVLLISLWHPALLDRLYTSRESEGHPYRETKTRWVLWTRLSPEDCELPGLTERQCRPVPRQPGKRIASTCYTYEQSTFVELFMERKPWTM